MGDSNGKRKKKQKMLYDFIRSTKNMHYQGIQMGDTNEIFLQIPYFWVDMCVCVMHEL